MDFDEVLPGVAYLVMLPRFPRGTDFEVLWGAPPIPVADDPDPNSEEWDEWVLARRFWFERHREWWPRPFFVLEKDDPWIVCAMPYWDPPMTHPADPERWERDARMATVRVLPSLLMWTWEENKFWVRALDEVPSDLDEDTRQQIVIERDLWGASDTELFGRPS